MREAYWFNGFPHGIAREWNLKGRMKRGFPEYWIRNKQVTKAQYIKKCLSDSTLQRFLESDNSPNRSFPEELVAKAKERVRAIRKHIDARPLVAEFGELTTNADQIFAFLRRSASFPAFKEGATWRISNNIWCRFEQIAPSYFGIQWFDGRWIPHRFRTVDCVILCTQFLRRVFNASR